MSITKMFTAAATLIVSLLPMVASAHAFGQQYTLPLPFGFYAFGAAVALVASFAIFLVLPLRHVQNTGARDMLLCTVPRWIRLGARWVSAACILLLLVTGFFGPQETISNLAPELFWMGWLLLILYAQALVGGLWRALNPIEPLVRFVLGSGYHAPLRYPSRLGVYPALVMYYLLIKLELLSLGWGALPQVVALVVCAYIFLSVLGAALYGADEWFTQADFTNVFFGLVGRCAPVQLSAEGRLSYSGLSRVVEEWPRQISVLFFILFLLASTAFDGLRETQVWQNTLFPFKLVVANYAFFEHLILALAPLLFFALYAAAVALMRVLGRSVRSLSSLLLRFAYSLVPIAVAYSFAHYFTLVVNGLQHVYALVSDPLGRGWDLFGTASYQINIGLVGAKEVWNIQLASIVLGHIVATYVAHRIAQKEFPRARDVLVGQLPMLVLMVLYTVFGLWLLSLAYASP